MEKERTIHEYVPGKQVTLAHLIAHPDPDLCRLLGLEEVGALGVLTITPSEAAIIAGDVGTKAAQVRIGFMDRFTGSLVLVGQVSAVESALRQINSFLQSTLGFFPAELTRS